MPIDLLYKLVFEMKVINSGCRRKHEQLVYKENKLLLQVVSSGDTIRQAK